MITKLQEDACWIENLVELEMRDSDGIIRSMLKLNTLKPWQAGDLSESDLHATIPGYEKMPYEGVLNYENTGMVQGTYLSALVLKYRVTGDASVLEMARRTFRGIVRVYEMSQTVAPGFYCKPWGIRAQTTNETSSDQYIYILCGLDDYYPIASSEEQHSIRTMIIAMVRFWLDHHYDWKYFGEMLHWPEVRFIAFMAMAFKYGGGADFATEQERLMFQLVNQPNTPFVSTISENLHKQPDGEVWIKPNPARCLSTYLSLESAMRKQNHPRFMEICRESIQFGKMGLAGDGTTYYKLIRNPKTGNFQEMDPHEYSFHPVHKLSSIFGLDAPYRRGGMENTMFARFVLAFEEFDSDCGGSLLAQNILTQVGTKHLTWFEDPYGIFPDEIRWMTNVFSGDAAANWLWCYWKLRLREPAGLSGN